MTNLQTLATTDILSESPSQVGRARKVFSVEEKKSYRSSLEVPFSEPRRKRLENNAWLMCFDVDITLLSDGILCGASRNITEQEHMNLSQSYSLDRCRSLREEDKVAFSF